MPINNINPNPRSLPLIHQTIGKWFIVDCGSMDGLAPVWKPMEAYADFLGFDPEICKSSDQWKSANTTSIAEALDSKVTQKIFHITKSKFCSGFHPINSDARRFPNWVNNETISEKLVSTTTLDEVLKNKQKPSFIKIDTEGSEFEVIQGAKSCLASCLGIFVEIWFGFKDVISAWDLCKFLEISGFTFFDISVQRYPRNTMPVGHILSNGLASPAFQESGQVLTADALFFKDPIKNNKNNLTDENILSLIGLLDLWGYQDFAIELAIHKKGQLKNKVDIYKLIDLLTPPIGSQRISFNDYWALSKKLFGPGHVSAGVDAKLEHPII